MKKLALFLTLIAFFSSSREGISQSIKPYYLFFKIDSVAELASDSIRTWFRTKPDLSLNPGREGWALGVKKPELKKHNQDLGKAVIVNQDGLHLVADIKLSNTNSSNDYVYPGDVLEFQVDLQALSYHDLFFNLSRLLIDFTNSYGDSFYKLEDLAKQDSQELEIQIIDSMAKDIRMVGIELYGPSDDIEIESGMFTGSTMFKGMMTTTSDDVKRFLNYVWEYRRTYWGESWMIAEVYATWLINNSPLTNEDMITYLKAAENDEEFLSRAQKYNLQNDPEIIMYWISDAEKLSNEGKHKQAREFLEICEKLNNLIMDPGITPWIFFTYGNIAQNENKYEEAISHFIESREKFKELNDLKGVSYNENNIGQCYLDMKQYDSAEIRLTTALEMKTGLFKDSEDPGWINSICISLESLHDVAIAVKDYKKAISFIEHEIYYRGLQNDQPSITKLNVTKSYYLAHLGQYEEAVKLYQKFYPGESPCMNSELSQDSTIACEETVLLMNKFSENPYYIALSYENLAKRMKSRGDIESTIAYYKLAIQSMKIADRNDETFQLMRDLSLIFPIPQNVDDKGELLEEMLEFSKSVWGVNSSACAIALAEWGIYNHIHAHKSSSTIPILVEAKNKLEITGLTEESIYSDVFVYLASEYRFTGRLMEADQCYQEYLNYLLKTYGEVSTNYAQGLQSYTSYLITIREMDKVKEHLSEADTIFHQLNCISDSRYAYFLGDVSAYYYYMEEDSIGEIYFNRSIDLIKKIYSENSREYSGMMLGRIIHLLNMNEFDEAESLARELFINNKEWYKEGKADRIDVGVYLGFINLVLIDKKEYKDALKYGKKALKIFEEEEGVDGFYYNNKLSDVKKTYEKTGKTKKAYKLYLDMLAHTRDQITRAFSYLSEEERNRFYAQRSYEFNDFGVFAINHHEKISSISEDLFNMQLYSKGLLLRSTTRLLNVLHRSNDSIALNLYHSFKNTKEQLAKGYALPEKKLKEENINLDSLEEAAGQLERQLNARVSNLNLTTEERIPDWKEVQSKLDNEDCLVEIMRIATSKDTIVYYAVLIITQKSKKPDLLFIKEGYGGLHFL